MFCISLIHIVERGLCSAQHHELELSSGLLRTPVQISENGVMIAMYNPISSWIPRRLKPLSALFVTKEVPWRDQEAFAMVRASNFTF